MSAPFKLNAEQIKQAAEAYKLEKLDLVATQFGVTRLTLSRALKREKLFVRKPQASKRVFLTDDQLAQVIELRAAKISIRNIATKVSCSQMVVRRNLVAIGKFHDLRNPAKEAPAFVQSDAPPAERPNPPKSWLSVPLRVSA